MAPWCWARAASCMKEKEEIASLRRLLRRGRKEAATESEGIKDLADRVASMERALAAAALQREATEARRREAERRAGEAEAALEAATSFGERSAREAWEKEAELEEKRDRVLELESQMAANRFDHRSL